MLERITEDGELIDALHHCADENIEMCPPCKYFAWDKPKDDCKFEMMRDAADAIERLQAENDELRAENETYHKLVLLSVGEINELRYKLHLDEMDIQEIKLP